MIASCFTELHVRPHQSFLEKKPLNIFAFFSFFFFFQFQLTSCNCYLLPVVVYVCVPRRGSLHVPAHGQQVCYHHGNLSVSLICEVGKFVRASYPADNTLRYFVCYFCWKENKMG